MNLPTENYSLFCLESIEDSDSFQGSDLFPMLEQLTLQFGITNIYQNCDSIENFESSIENLLYHDSQFRDYEVIYLSFKGRNNTIEIGNYLYSFEEIAEMFQGRLQDKILHFSNLMYLDLDEETAQYFLDVTGAKAISGYAANVPIVSTKLDYYYFSTYATYDDIFELVEELFDKYPVLYQSTGFRMYY